MKAGLGRAARIWVFLIAVGTSRADSNIQFDDFRSIDGLTLVGDARVIGRVLRLTPARRNQTGAAWLREKQAVRSGFETTFQFQLTHQDWIFHGTDGFAFVVQNSGPGAIGGRGSAAGFGTADPTNPHHDGIPWMIAIFFDTLRNPEEKDPSSNYIGIRANGGPGKMRWPPTRLSFTPNLRVRLKDHKVHTAHVVFQPPLLSVFLDGADAPVLATAVDVSAATDQGGDAWVGFTAATGWGYQNHDIVSWCFRRTSVLSNLAVVSSDITFPMSACLANRNLCTPDRPFIERRGGEYHIVLPANLVWAVSIPNPSGRPVAVMNAKGVVCWDMKAPAAQGCSGPFGNGGAAGKGFLAEEKPAGALIMRTQDGRTWFSVNGHSGLAFDSSEGFYEFDSQVR